MADTNISLGMTFGSGMILKGRCLKKGKILAPRIVSIATSLSNPIISLFLYFLFFSDSCESLSCISIF